MIPMPDPKTIHVSAYNPFPHQGVPPDTTIIIKGDPPEFHGPDALEQHQKFYEQQAADLLDALYNSLPQGTFDRLGMAFMQKKVSLYRGRTE